MTATPHLRPLRIDPHALKLEPLDLDPTDFQSPLPVQNHHLVFEDAVIGLAVGIWDTTTMQEAFGPYPGDEYITVLDGSFAILDANGEAVSGHAGQSATFRNGVPVSWKQDGYLRKIYLTLLDPKGETPVIASAKGGVRALDPARAVAASPGADGVAREMLFRNDAGTMTVTDCAYPALDMPPTPAAAHELCRVLQGEIILTDPDGGTHRSGPDAHFFLPLGAACARTIRAGTRAWHVAVTA